MHTGNSPLFHEKVQDQYGEPISLTYFPAKRLRLRNILSHPIEERIEKDEPGAHDSDKWKRWQESITEACEGFKGLKPDFENVRGHFQQFTDFVHLMRTLRSFIVEEAGNKRWSSSFIFPFGPSVLYEDLDINKDKVERQYIYFTRSGEILYQMLCRSSHRDELNALLLKLLIPGNPWNEFCRCLEVEDATNREPRTGSILPYLEHPRFDALAADWCAILRLDLPPTDAIPHLITLAGFHLMIFVQEVACSVLNRDRCIYICEILAPKRTTVRAQSIANFDTNRRLSEDAVAKELESIRGRFTNSSAPQDNEAAREYLVKETGWGADELAPTPEELFEKLNTKVLKTHRDHLGKVHSAYGRGIGLVSRRGSNRNRYVPSDSFLKTLALATVPTHREFKALMKDFYDKYGLVFGDTLADSPMVGANYSKADFKQNAQRLERRLASLGLLKRKSDGCAYVFNPHRSQEVAK
jgi:hypothetical protein